MSQRVFTIGVYGTTEATFFIALCEHGITHFIDVRRRRGMRGSQYAYANATALQKKLREVGIEYEHHRELSPSKEIREVQKAADTDAGTTKTARIQLCSEFVRRYESECLAGFDVCAFLGTFPENAKLVLFCVEKQPQACHRSLLAEHIQGATGVVWRDITPGGSI
ncbi:MAG: hypothetical protein AKCLJLPJ_02009 [Fimbriimonadales bacterium]|nr:hypothetical protein [Fimbriimonadales bacterium]